MPRNYRYSSNFGTTSDYSDGTIIISNDNSCSSNMGIPGFEIELPKNLNVFSKSKEKLVQIYTMRVGPNVRKFVETVKRVLAEQSLDATENPIPQILFQVESNDSVSAEWIFVSFRFGFVFESNISSESSWFFIGKNGTKQLWESDDFHEEKIYEEVQKIVNYVLENT